MPASALLCRSKIPKTSFCSARSRTLVLKNIRYGSSHAHPSYGPEYEVQEGFGHPLFRWLGVTFIGLAVYLNYPSISTASSDSVTTDLNKTAEDQRQPWLTRYLAYHLAGNPEEAKSISLHNMGVVFAAADTAYFKASIERPPMRRLANSGDFKIASPYGLVPGAQTDLSDLRIKSYRDDLMKPSRQETEED